jgi:hypothetical protein
MALRIRASGLFFSDSEQALANLRRATGAGAESQFVAWRSATKNRFVTTAERGAAAPLPNIPARQRDASGQFTFADQRPRRGILD